MISYEVRGRFPPDPASAAKARRFLNETLRGWRCDHLVDVATLLVSELVANAILHAGTTIEVVARATAERLRIEVYDDKRRMPLRKHYSTMSATGRGLFLVEQLAADWGSEATESGKRVWFELDKSPAAEEKDAPLLGFADLDLDDLGSAESGGPTPKDRDGGSTSGSPRLQVLVRTRP